MSRISKQIQDLKKKIASISPNFLTKDDDFSFTSFSWNSSVGIDACLSNSKRFISQLPAKSEYVGKMFIAAGRGGDNKGILIHKTKHCLWKFSKDNSYIEPVFASDVLSVEDLDEDINTMENEG